MTPTHARLLFVSPLPPPPGGIATWTSEVVGGPLAARFEMQVVDTSPSEAKQIDQPVRFSLRRAFDGLALLGHLLRVLLRFRPQLVHVNTSYYWAFLRDGLCLWLASLLGARTLLHLRGGDFPSFHAGCPAPLRLLVDATLRRADRLIALTRETERFLVERAGGDKTCYVPNFVRAAGVAVPDRTGGGRPVEILYVGWILEAKGLRELLCAARGLPEARFTLVGPPHPPFVDAIRSELDALGGRVRLLGPRPREALAELYAHADLLVLPTHREGFPNVVLEAMAAGLPVVATPVGAIPDAIRDGEDGLLVPPRDPAALESALRALIDDPARRRTLGRSARRRVEERFDMAAVMDRLERVYSGLLATEPARAH